MRRNQFMSYQIIPLGIKNRSKTELPALIALEAIGQPWFNENHRCDLMSIALVTQLMTPPDSEVHQTSCALVELLGPDELALEELRPHVIAVNSWLQRQPNEKVQAAIDRLLGRAPKKSMKRAHG